MKIYTYFYCAELYEDGILQKKTYGSLDRDDAITGADAFNTATDEIEEKNQEFGRYDVIVTALSLLNP